MNLYTFTGNIGQDPKFFPEADGKKARVSFSMAVRNSGRKKEDGSDPAPKWVNVTAWGQTANYVNQYLKKGSRVLVSGQLSWGEFTHKESGQPVETTDCAATSVEGFAAAEGAGKTTAAASNAVADDSIPF